MRIFDTIIVLACFRQLQVTIRPNTDMSGFTLGKALEMAAQFIDGRLQSLILQQPRHDWKCHGPKPLSSIQKIGTWKTLAALQTLRHHFFMFGDYLMLAINEMESMQAIAPQKNTLCENKTKQQPQNTF